MLSGAQIAHFQDVAAASQLLRQVDAAGLDSGLDAFNDLERQQVERFAEADGLEVEKHLDEFGIPELEEWDSDLLNEAIAAMQQALREAETPGPQPLEFFEGDNLEEKLHTIPNLGSLNVEGWVEQKRLFVDSSGFGSPGEPALTYSELICKVDSLLLDGPVGLAIVEEGQFQVYVGVFRRSTSK